MSDEESNLELNSLENPEGPMAPEAQMGAAGPSMGAPVADLPTSARRIGSCL